MYRCNSCRKRIVLAPISPTRQNRPRKTTDHFALPDGFKELLAMMVKALLRHRPLNLVGFFAQYLEAQYNRRVMQEVLFAAQLAPLPPKPKPSYSPEIRRLADTIVNDASFEYKAEARAERKQRRQQQQQPQQQQQQQQQQETEEDDDDDEV